MFNFLKIIWLLHVCLVMSHGGCVCIKQGKQEKYATEVMMLCEGAPSKYNNDQRKEMIYQHMGFA